MNSKGMAEFIKEYKDYLISTMGEDAEFAEKTTLCKRKGVHTEVIDITEINKDRFKSVGSWDNGPLFDEPERCSGEKGNCGCVHAEFKAVVSLLRSQKQEPSNKLIFLSSFAPCVPCANLIVLSKLAGAVLWLKEAPHHIGAWEILRASNIIAQNINQ